MRFVKKTGIILIIITMMTPLFAQNSAKNQSMLFKSGDWVQKPTGFVDKLIDPAKFNMSQSYSFSAGSLGKKSFSQGVYLNQMSYQLAKPLSVQLGIGMMHQPFGSESSPNTRRDPNQFFINNARIQYKPSDTFSITVDYQSRPAMWGSSYYSQW